MVRYVPPSELFNKHISSPSFFPFTHFFSYSLSLICTIRITHTPTTNRFYTQQEASLKKERANMSDEQRERLLIAEQIERAKAEQESRGVSSGPGLGSRSGSGSDGEGERGEGGEGKEKKEEGLKRGEGEKVVLSFSLSKPIGVSGTNGVKEG